jgi:hypothetical protein
MWLRCGSEAGREQFGRLRLTTEQLPFRHFSCLHDARPFGWCWLDAYEV